MRFGYCAALDQAPLLAAAGYDYVEPAVVSTLRPEAPEDEVMPGVLEAVAAASIKPEAFNVFLPGDLKVASTAADPERQTLYLQSAFARVAAAGGKIVVFGSGVARTVPDGTSSLEAADHILAFLDRCAPLAAAHGVTVVIEPLNRGEANIIHNVTEALQYVYTIGSPAIRVLSDLYHITVEGQSYGQTELAGDALKHVHVAGRVDRRVPTDADIDFLAPYFAVLKRMGYDGRISVEARAEDIATQAPIALAVMRRAWEIA